LKQGLQDRSSFSTCDLSDKGGVNCGLLEPKIAIIGLPSAAAMCIRPESLLTVSFAQDSSATASPRSVRPHRLTQAWPASSSISSATALSLPEPNSQTAYPCAIRRRASSA
jgi:hypothetical protein